LKKAKLILGWLFLVWGVSWLAFSLLILLAPEIFFKDSYVLQGAQSTRAYLAEDFGFLLSIVFGDVLWPAILPVVIGVILLYIPAGQLQDYIHRLANSAKRTSDAAKASGTSRMAPIQAESLKNIHMEAKRGRIAKVALALGILMLLYAMFMDISVQAGYGRRVVNLDLMSQRQTLLMVGGIAVISALIALFFGRGSLWARSIKHPSEWKTCPQCAEEIRAAAVKCRYCQAELDGALNKCNVGIHAEDN